MIISCVVFLGSISVKSLSTKITSKLQIEILGIISFKVIFERKAWLLLGLVRQVCLRILMMMDRLRLLRDLLGMLRSFLRTCRTLSRILRMVKS